MTENTLRGKCECGFVFVIAYLHMPLRDAAQLAIGARCPKCASSKIFVAGESDETSPRAPGLRILFLDVDGVLNHRDVFRAGNPAPLCPAALEQLFRVIETTGCRVVLSSTWRKIPGLVDKLPERLTREHFHGDWRTIELLGKHQGGLIIPDKRGDEVAEWLARHPEVERYAIVDDDSDFLEDQQSHFVQTRFDAGGLIAEHADRLITILAPPRADGGAGIVMKHTDIAGTS